MNAAPLLDLFVAHELPPTFIEDLQAVIVRLENAIETHADKRGTQVAATASIEDAMETAMDTVYRLDGIVPNKIKNNPATLREWDAARRVARPHSGAKGSVPPSTTDVSPAA